VIPSPDQTYLARTFEDDRHPWARTRRVRRRLVIAEAGLLLVLVIATLVAAVAGEPWKTEYLVVWTVGLLVFIPLHSFLNLGIRGLFDRRGRSLDEHQRRLRERSASAVGWAATMLHLTAWVGGVAIAALTDQTGIALALGFLLWFSAGLLAYWHLSWTLPDENLSLEHDV
jgi:zinc transporter ZupT